MVEWLRQGIPAARAILSVGIRVCQSELLLTVADSCRAISALRSPLRSAGAIWVRTLPTARASWASTIWEVPAADAHAVARGDEPRAVHADLRRQRGRAGGNAPARRCGSARTGSAAGAAQDPAAGDRATECGRRTSRTRSRCRCSESAISGAASSRQCGRSGRTPPAHGPVLRPGGLNSAVARARPGGSARADEPLPSRGAAGHRALRRPPRAAPRRRRDGVFRLAEWPWR